MHPADTLGSLIPCTRVERILAINPGALATPLAKAKASCNIFEILHRLGVQGEPLLDPVTRTASVVMEKYVASKGDVWSSKEMLQIIQRKSGQLREEAPPGPRIRSAGVVITAWMPSITGFWKPAGQGRLRICVRDEMCQRLSSPCVQSCCNYSYVPVKTFEKRHMVILLTLLPIRSRKSCSSGCIALLRMLPGSSVNSSSLSLGRNVQPCCRSSGHCAKYNLHKMCDGFGVVADALLHLRQTAAAEQPVPWSPHAEGDPGMPPAFASARPDSPRSFSERAGSDADDGHFDEDEGSAISRDARLVDCGGIGFRHQLNGSVGDATEVRRPAGLCRS